MESVKPDVTEIDAAQVFKECLGAPANSISLVSSGMIAATFECIIGCDTYFVQFNEPNMAQGERTELLLAKRLADAGVPVRHMVCEGNYKTFRYTVSVKADGCGLSELSKDELITALPSVFNILKAMSQIDLNDIEGFGWFDESGRGKFGSWKANLMHILDEEPGDFYGTWHGLFVTTFLEKERFERYVGRMADLLDSFATPRQLVHGGFGYDNVLVQKGEVSAVLDWQDARIGDGLFDVAYMDFWPCGLNLVEEYRQWCEQRDSAPADYQQRIACYKYYTAADGMRFFAKTNNKTAYDAVIKIAEGIEAAN